MKFSWMSQLLELEGLTPVLDLPSLQKQEKDSCSLEKGAHSPCTEILMDTEKLIIKYRATLFCT